MNTFCRFCRTCSPWYTGRLVYTKLLDITTCEPTFPIGQYCALQKCRVVHLVAIMCEARDGLGVVRLSLKLCFSLVQENLLCNLFWVYGGWQQFTCCLSWQCSVIREHPQEKWRGQQRGCAISLNCMTLCHCTTLSLPDGVTFSAFLWVWGWVAMLLHEYTRKIWCRTCLAALACRGNVQKPVQDVGYHLVLHLVAFHFFSIPGFPIMQVHPLQEKTGEGKQHQSFPNLVMVFYYQECHHDLLVSCGWFCFCCL